MEANARRSSDHAIQDSSYRPPPAGQDSFYRPPPVAATAIDSDLVQARLLKFQNETGYEMIQRHGQRIYGGPPPHWDGQVPGKGTEVYCFRIPRDCFEDELVPVFSKAGPIHELRLMIEFSGTNRTYCYVRYSKKEHATEAIRSLNGYEIRRGHHLAVTKSVDNRRLWINGIPKNRSAEEFKEELEAITGGISNVILYPSQTEANRTRSYMFVEYETHRAAALARRKLVPGKVFLFGVEVGQVDWAEPEPEVDEEQMKQIKILYVRHLNMATTEQTLMTCFSQLSNGQVDRVRKPKDYAFIHFTSREAAELVMSRCDSLYMDGQKVEVMWAKPPDKTPSPRSWIAKPPSPNLPSPRRTGAPTRSSWLCARPTTGVSPSTGSTTPGSPSAESPSTT